MRVRNRPDHSCSLDTLHCWWWLVVWGKSRRDRAGQRLNKRTDLIPNSPKVRHRFIIRSCPHRKPRRIVKAHMHDPRAGKTRASSRRGITNRHNHVEARVNLIRPLRDVAGNINTRFHHRANRQRVHPMRRRPRRICLDLSTLQSPRPPLGHLAAARVPRTQKQHTHPAPMAWHSILLRSTQRLPQGSTHGSHPQGPSASCSARHTSPRRTPFFPLSKTATPRLAQAVADAAKRPTDQPSSTPQPRSPCTPSRTWQDTPAATPASDRTTP